MPRHRTTLRSYTSQPKSRKNVRRRPDRVLQVARFFVSATFLILSRFGFRSFETALLHTSMKSVVTDSCVPLSLRAPTTHTHTRKEGTACGVRASLTNCGEGLCVNLKGRYVESALKAVRCVGRPTPRCRRQVVGRESLGRETWMVAAQSSACGALGIGPAARGALMFRQMASAASMSWRRSS